MSRGLSSIPHTNEAHLVRPSHCLCVCVCLRVFHESVPTFQVSEMLPQRYREEGEMQHATAARLDFGFENNFLSSTKTPGGGRVGSLN